MERCGAAPSEARASARRLARTGHIFSPRERTGNQQQNDSDENLPLPLGTTIRAILNPLFNHQTNTQDPLVPTTAVILTTQETALSTCTYDVGITLGNNLLKTESRISMTENFRTTNYEKLQQTGQVFLARNPGTISPKLKRPWQLQD